MGFARRFVNVSSGLCNPVMLQVSPVTTHCIAMNGANVVMGSHHSAGETFQNDAETSRRNIKGARLEPDAIRVRHPETLIFKADVSNEVFAAPSIRLEAVGKIIEGSDRHKTMIGGQRSPVRCQESWRQPCYFFSAGAAAVAGRSEFQMSVPHLHVPPFFSQTSQYLPRSFVPSFIVIS